MVNFKSRSIYSHENNIGTHRIKGWVGPRIGADVLKKTKTFVLAETQTPARPIIVRTTL